MVRLFSLLVFPLTLVISVSVAWKQAPTFGTITTQSASPQPECTDAVQCAAECERGVGASCYKLGQMYYNGESGLPKDLERSVSFYLKACDRGHASACNGAGWAFELGSGVPKDAARAVELYKKSCDSGYALGCNELGRLYKTGTGAVKNPTLAAQLFDKACKGGSLYGCTNLGAAYESGNGVTKNVGRAVELYQSSCDNGEAAACDWLGDMYYYGTDIPKDLKTAAPLFKRACENGKPNGCNKLGVLYQSGNGVAKSESHAIAFYQKACNGGESFGCNNLAMMYRDGKSVQVDHAAAAALFKKACDLGRPEACTDLGVDYEIGRGVVKDETRAFELYQRACEGKEAAGCANLGNLYSDGRGTRRDLAQAVTSYKVACDADLARGCSGLGYAYGVGEGVTKDLVRAAQLYQKACNGEYWLACNNLAVVYRDGLGVARDEVRSVPLFKKACDNGEPHACYNLGIAYEFAHGVSMDEDIAKQFYEKACHASNATACSNLQRLNQESGNSVQAVEEKPRGIANEARQDASQKVSRPPRSLQGKNYAVLFAGSEYEHWPSLVNPVVDAKAVAEELQQSYGFETRLVPNPTSEQIFSVLMEYAKKNPPLGPSDQLFVFVAGHGDFIESTKEGFLVGRNSLRAKDDPGHATYVPHSRLQVILSNLSAGHVLLVMDSCFSGTFDRRITHRGSRGEEDPYATASLPEFVDRMMKYPTRLYLTSGGKEYVPDGRPNEHSPFARQLLLALRNNGGPRGYLTMSRLIEYFERVQPEPMYGEFQGNEPGGDFIFVPTR